MRIGFGPGAEGSVGGAGKTFFAYFSVSSRVLEPPFTLGRNKYVYNKIPMERKRAMLPPPSRLLVAADYVEPFEFLASSLGFFHKRQF